MIVSTWDLSISSPFSANSLVFCAFNANGLVTTPTVKIPVFLQLLPPQELRQYQYRRQDMQTARGEVQIAKKGNGYNAVWSPDGTRIAFESGPGTRSGYNSIYIVGRDGRGLHRLPGMAIDMGCCWSTGNLAWSPDGTQILFAGRTQMTHVRWPFLVPADGGGRPRPLAIGTRLVAPIQPVWSPDGSKIAFSVEQDPGAGVYVMHTDGSDVQLIAAGGHGAVWSPDGSMIAFRTTGRGGNWTVRADGTHRVALPPSSHAGFSWSPSSKLIAFVGPKLGDVLVVKPNGTHVVRLLHRPDLRYILPLWQHGTASTETN